MSLPRRTAAAHYMPAPEGISNSAVWSSRRCLVRFSDGCELVVDDVREASERRVEQSQLYREHYTKQQEERRTSPGRVCAICCISRFSCSATWITVRPEIGDQAEEAITLRA